MQFIYKFWKSKPNWLLTCMGVMAAHALALVWVGTMPQASIGTPSADRTDGIIMATFAAPVVAPPVEVPTPPAPPTPPPSPPPRPRPVVPPKPVPTPEPIAPVVVDTPSPIAAQPEPQQDTAARETPSSAPTTEPAAAAASRGSSDQADTTSRTALVMPSSHAAYLNNPAPPYPAMSRRFNEQGLVVLRVFINTDGQAEHTELYQSSGHRRLDDSALRTVAQWRFVPGTRYGVPQAMWFNVPINFVLE